jgi:hypothetical protein
LKEKAVRPPGDDDAELVPRPSDVLDDHAAAGCVAHAFADDTVKDAHAGDSCTNRRRAEE